jgi:uncharacterized membrane protein
MNIQLLTSVLILLASFGSAIWNLDVKESKNSLKFVTLMVVPQFLVASLLAAIMPFPNLHSLYYIIISSLVQTIYIIFLSSAYRYGMLSNVYPLEIGTATLLALVWHIVLGMKLSLSVYFGVIILSFSVISFTLIGFRYKNVKSIYYAFGTAIFIFLYSITDSTGIRLANNPFSYIAWLFLIKALMLFIPMLMLGKIQWHDIEKRKDYIVPGLLAGFGYGVAMIAYIYSLTAVVLALRSTAILFIYFLSRIVLKEKVSAGASALTFSASIGVFLILIS